MKTVLIIENSIAPTGAFRCALQEADLLSGSVRVVFAVPAGSSVIPQLREKGYVYYTLPYREISRSLKAIAGYPFYLLSNLIRLKRIVRREKADVLQVNDFYNLLGAAMKFTGYKGMVLTWVRFLPGVIPAPLRKLWTAAALRYSDRVIAVSDAVKKQLPPHRKVIRVYDPVALEERYASTRRASPEVACLYLANYIQGKGQEHALEAFSEAFRVHKGLSLHFYGGDMGLDKNKAFRERLHQRVKALDLESSVFLHGFSDDVEKTIKSSDLLLNFSEAESFSLTCLEASYYGVPVIATRCGGPEEIIVDGETGCLVAKGDIAAMREAILFLAGDASARAAYSEAGRKYVRRKFDPESFRKQLLSMIYTA